MGDGALPRRRYALGPAPPLVVRLSDERMSQQLGPGQTLAKRNAMSARERRRGGQRWADLGSFWSRPVMNERNRFDMSSGYATGSFTIRWISV